MRKKASDIQLRHLEQKHRTLDAKLGELLSQPHLTPQEHQLARELKVRKLMTKDEITALKQSRLSP